MYWVFNASQLDQALAAFEARRQGEGATEQQAQDEATLIKLFLISPESRARQDRLRQGLLSRAALDRKEFTLTQPTAPLELRRPAAHEEAMSEAVRDAMQAALAGDFSALDKLELEYLNLLARIGELVMRHPDGRLHWWFDQRQRTDRENHTMETHAPFVVAYRRGFGPRAVAALEWGLYEKCRRCDGRLRHLPCRVCEGRWYVEDMNDHELLYTDIDGVLLEDAAR